MAYTTINKSTLHHDCNLYQANGSGLTISGMEFKPDFIWTKNRSTGNYFPALVDAVRGGTKKIFSCNDNAESTDSGAVTSFTSDGYVFGSSGSFNYSTNNYVNWCWKAAGTSGSSNGDGSITSTVSANQTAGFSIVTYTGTSSNATVGHGLNAVPKFIMAKRLTDAESWGTYHVSNGAGKYMKLENTEAVQTASTVWNGTTPTSSVFSLGTSGLCNGSGKDMVAYCFAEIKGFSKFGSYTGNGNADGTFIYTGFKPKWIMLKRTDSADWWGLWDNKRLGYNPDNYHMRINETNYTEASKVVEQFSNGFKIKETDTAINASGGNYIYMAFGQSLVGSNNVPCTAR